jgi:transcriptional regulator with GAF, ATPase, and Fis domain
MDQPWTRLWQTDPSLVAAPRPEAEAFRLPMLHLEAGAASPHAPTAGGTRMLIGQSHAFLSTMDLARKVAPTDVPVLLLGETGVGKGCFANVIHAASRRGRRPMVRMNSAALPAPLAESELFGRERGAFTGADRRELGRFEVAQGSTLFLDEIGEMPLEVQAKLLRVLEDGSFERLGSPHAVRVNARIVAATNRDLAQEVRDGRFRRDLFFRLNVFPIEVPALRDRRDDILPLAASLAAAAAADLGRPPRDFSPEAIELLRNHPWPGNVRQLQNVVVRAVFLSEGDRLTVDLDDPVGTIPDAPSDDSLRATERQHVLRVLDRCGWRIRGSGGAAVLLGLPPTTLESKMVRLGIFRRR